MQRVDVKQERARGGGQVAGEGFVSTERIRPAGGLGCLQRGVEELAQCLVSC